jgi:hypothetical protein
MLYAIAFVLVVLWVVGLITSYTFGGLVHVLLAIAVLTLLLKVFTGPDGSGTRTK